MKKYLSLLMAVPFLACAISGGPLDPAGDPTPSGAETSPPPDPLAGNVVTTRDPLAASDLGRARETMRTIERLAQHLEAWRSRNGRYPDAPSARELVLALGGTDADRPEFTDGWDRPLHYEALEGGSSYVIASAGSDGEIESDDWASAAELSNPAQDLVYRNGAWVRRWP